MSSEVRTTASIENIISFYEFISDVVNSQKKFDSGKSYTQIANELIRGVFIPAAGMKEVITIIQEGKEKILSFDFDYFREKATTKGVSWEELLEKSHKLYPTNYLT
jgi:hypothetical protein